MSETDESYFFHVNFLMNSLTGKLTETRDFSCQNHAHLAAGLGLASVIFLVTSVIGSIFIATVVLAKKTKALGQSSGGLDEESLILAQKLSGDSGGRRQRVFFLQSQASEDLSDLYEISPQPLEIITPLRRGGSRINYSIPVISEEDESEYVEAEYGSRNSQASHGFGSMSTNHLSVGLSNSGNLSNLLKVPMTDIDDGHINVYRTSSQELVEQISRFLFTNEDVFSSLREENGSSTDSKAKVRRRSSSGSVTGKKIRRISTMVQENVIDPIGKKISSLPNEEIASNSTTPRKDSTKPSSLMTSLSAPVTGLTSARSPRLMNKRVKSVELSDDESNDGYSRNIMRAKNIHKLIAAFSGRSKQSIDRMDDEVELANRSGAVTLKLSKAQSLDQVNKPAKERPKKLMRQSAVAEDTPREANESENEPQPVKSIVAALERKGQETLTSPDDIRRDSVRSDHSVNLRKTRELELKREEDLKKSQIMKDLPRVVISSPKDNAPPTDTIQLFPSISESRAELINKERDIPIIVLSRMNETDEGFDC